MKMITILILFTVLLTLIQFPQIQADQGIPATSLIGHRLITIPVYNRRSPDYTILYQTISSPMINIISECYSRNPPSIVIYNYTLYTNNIGMEVAWHYIYINNTLVEIRVTPTDMILIRVGTGYDYPFRRLGPEFSYCLRYYILYCAYYEHFTQNLTVVYGGLFGEEIVNVSRLPSDPYRVYGRDAYIVNNSDGSYTVYIHPYEKYYLLYNGYRLVYPVIVRGMDPDNPVRKGLVFQYFLGAIPTPNYADTDVRVITVDEGLLGEIAEAYNWKLELNGIVPRNYSIDDLRIITIYYDYVDRNGMGTYYYYAPYMLVAGLNNTWGLWLYLDYYGRVHSLNLVNISSIDLETLGEKEINVTLYFGNITLPPHLEENNTMGNQTLQQTNNTTTTTPTQTKPTQTQSSVESEQATTTKTTTPTTSRTPTKTTQRENRSSNTNQYNPQPIITDIITGIGGIITGYIIAWVISRYTRRRAAK